MKSLENVRGGMTRSFVFSLRISTLFTWRSDGAARGGEFAYQNNISRVSFHRHVVSKIKLSLCVGFFTFLLLSSANVLGAVESIHRI